VVASSISCRLSAQGERTSPGYGAPLLVRRLGRNQLDFLACTFAKVMLDQRGLPTLLVQQLAASDPAADRREFLDGSAEDLGLIDDAE
jgi:hypothetical protein